MSNQDDCLAAHAEPLGLGSGFCDDLEEEVFVGPGLTEQDRTDIWAWSDAIRWAGWTFFIVEPNFGVREVADMGPEGGMLRYSLWRRVEDGKLAIGLSLHGEAPDEVDGVGVDTVAQARLIIERLPYPVVMPKDDDCEDDCA